MSLGLHIPLWKNIVPLFLFKQQPWGPVKEYFIFPDAKKIYSEINCLKTKKEVYWTQHNLTQTAHKRRKVSNMKEGFFKLIGIRSS